MGRSGTGGGEGEEEGRRSKRKHKGKGRMSYLRNVKQRGGGGWGGGGGGDRYVSAYGPDGRKKYQKEYLRAGMRGFLLSTNFKESDCVKDGYSLLNEYYVPEVEVQMPEGKDEGVQQNNPEGSKGMETEAVSSSTASVTKAHVEEEDIDKALEEEMKELRGGDGHGHTSYKFKAVDSGIKNLVFIKVADTIKRPSDILYRIFEDVFEKKETKSRFILRFLPVEGSCFANDADIRQLAKEMFPPYFKDGYKTYKIVANIKYSKLSRDQVITSLAEVVSEINSLNVVNLSDPEYTIIVEVLKSVACLSVVKDFVKYKKFNITEIVSPTPVPQQQQGKDKQEKTNETQGSIQKAADEPAQVTPNETDTKPEVGDQKTGGNEEDTKDASQPETEASS